MKWILFRISMSILEINKQKITIITKPKQRNVNKLKNNIDSNGIFVNINFMFYFINYAHINSDTLCTNRHYQNVQTRVWDQRLLMQLLLNRMTPINREI